MSVRVRVAVALVVAAVVPTLGMFGVVVWLLPNQVGAKDTARLLQASTAASSLLTRDCEALGDSAALIASRLLVRVSVADATIRPAVTVADEAARVVSRSQEDPLSVVVVDVDGEVVTASGPDSAALAADPAALLQRSCREGVLGEPAVLAVALPFGNAETDLGSVVVATPLHDAAVDALARQVGLDGGLAVVSAGAVTGFGGTVPPGGAGADDADRDDALVDLLEEAEAVQADPEAESKGRVGDQPLALSGSALGDVTVLAVGRAPNSVDPTLALAFVVTAFATAALVWLLSSLLTRPLTELGDLARRIAAGDDVPAGIAERGTTDADADVQGVSAVLGSLARDLRASEADADQSRGAFRDAFSRFGDALQQTHDRDGLLQTVLQAALLASDAPIGLALHHDRSSRLSRRELGLRARSRDDGPTPLDDLMRRTLSGIAEQALVGRTVIELPGTEERGPVLAVPLGSLSRPLGAVVVARDVGAAGFDAVAFEAIGALATNAGTALANIKDHQEVERLSVTDPLTGVNNFRHLSTMLAREMERATRFGHPLGVLMLDIDRFKPVNDTHGHAAGDAVLRELARRVKECVREVDTVARYGGEEFALLLPETDLDGADRLAHRVLVSIRSERFRLPDGTQLAITASMGVAGFPHHGSTASEVMSAADAALYLAKAGGRDRVEVARTSQEATAGSSAAGPSGAGSPDLDLSP